MSGKEGMGLIVINYFNNLFSVSNGDYPSVTELIEPVVSDSDNDRLLAPFSANEFHRAVFQMRLSKALDPDGMNSPFYQMF